MLCISSLRDTEICIFNGQVWEWPKTESPEIGGPRVFLCNTCFH